MATIERKIWRVVVEIPEDAVSQVKRNELFDLVADAVYEWEPDDRDGWDIVVMSETEHSVEHLEEDDDGGA